MMPTCTQYCAQHFPASNPDRQCFTSPTYSSHFALFKSLFFRYFLPSKVLKNMDDEFMRARLGKAEQSAAMVRTVLLRILGSLITMVMLLWAIRCGFKLVIDSRSYISYPDWAFHVGILTMLFGLLFLMLGIPILVDLFLNLSEKLQEDAGFQKAKEMKTICRVTARILTTTITMMMLWCTIYVGFRLATEPRRENKHHLLTISIGMVTIVFGFIYFIIGLAIIAELGTDLLGQLQQREKQGCRQLSRLKQQC